MAHITHTQLLCYIPSPLTTPDQRYMHDPRTSGFGLITASVRTARLSIASYISPYGETIYVWFCSSKSSGTSAFEHYREHERYDSFRSSFASLSRSQYLINQISSSFSFSLSTSLRGLITSNSSLLPAFSNSASSQIKTTFSPASFIISRNSRAVDN